MTQRNNIKLSPLELKAMEALWKLGRASIREILEQLPVGKKLAYTTVQTLVFRLEAKGAVQKLRKIGNAHIFVPVITRRQAYRRLVSDFLELVQRFTAACDVPSGRYRQTDSGRPARTGKDPPGKKNPPTKGCNRGPET